MWFVRDAAAIFGTPEDRLRTWALEMVSGILQRILSSLGMTISRADTEARTLVPSFGNWDTGAEIPYTTVFEKVRATKDGKPLHSRGLEVSSQTPTRHPFQGHPSSIYPQYESDKYSNVSSELHSGKRSVLDEWGIQNKRTADLQSSSSRRSSLEQIADHIFTESQHAAGNETPVISRQSTSSNTSWQGNQYVSSRELREPYIKENLFMQPVPGGLPNGFNQGGLPSSHTQSSLANFHKQVYQVYDSRVSTASPRKEQFHANGLSGSQSLCPTSNIQMYQPFQANHRSGKMPPDRALPKFGDWDAMDPTKVEFTVIFDKARTERKVSNQENSTKSKTNPEVDEDLYKPSSTAKRNGFWNWICCSSPAVF
ncbi:hypothetical protein L7F22_031530 [Adiantum nelumboides]|nr:hypothetical protein [Adiantum nelumboides]